MSLSDRIIQDLKAAMKSRDEARRDTLRLLKSQIHNKEIELGSSLTEDDEIQVLNSAVKSRKESLELYQKGNRPDLAEKEFRELEIIQSYLPRQLSEDELAQAIEKIVAETGASSVKDLGKVMKEVMNHYRGQVDGKKVQEIVRNKLS